MERILRSRFRDERGSALVLTGLCLVTILGMLALVGDIGLLFLDRTQLSRAADAAALAGAALMEEGESTVMAEAQDYLIKNGVDASGASIEVDLGNQLVKVSLERQVNFFFAPIFGSRSAMASATSAAQNGVVTAVKGVAPVGIEDQTLVFGQRYVLKWSSDATEMESPFGQGNFGILDFDAGGGGASDYRSYAKDGYSEMVRVGDIVAAETGNKSGPTIQGFMDRIASSDPECTWQNIKPDCDRTVILPVYQTIAGSGSNQSFKIMGFAAFWLEEVKGQGTNSYMKGYFVKTYLPGEIDIGQTDYGIRNIRLVF